MFQYRQMRLRQHLYLSELPGMIQEQHCLREKNSLLIIGADVHKVVILGVVWRGAEWELSVVSWDRDA